MTDTETMTPDELAAALTPDPRYAELFEQHAALATEVRRLTDQLAEEVFSLAQVRAALKKQLDVNVTLNKQRGEARADLAERDAAITRVRAVVDQYAITDDETPTDWEGKPVPVVEYTEPEDVWRLFRDLRAALNGVGQPEPKPVHELVREIAAVVGDGCSVEVAGWVVRVDRVQPGSKHNHPVPVVMPHDWVPISGCPACKGAGQ